jgi:tetratricopeptide (TPR) repeat protein
VHTPLILLLCLGAASPSGEERALAQGERLFDALEFDAAASAFEAALREPATRDERLREWKGLALSKAFMGQSKQAQSYFEELLAVDPDADVSRSLGPKIRKPFEAARKKLRGTPRPVLKVARREDGHVEVMLENAPVRVTKLAVYVRQPGEPAFQVTQDDAPGPVVVKAPAVRAVEAYAVALDEAQGVLVEQGSATAPMRFDATEEPPPAVAAAREPVREEPALEKRPRPLWPFVVGGVGVAVAAGVVAGVVLSQPPELKLPPADRTGRLP